MYDYVLRYSSFFNYFGRDLSKYAHSYGRVCGILIIPVSIQNLSS